MKPYQPEVPRAAFALAAVALTALTIASLVVAPAVLDSGFEPDFVVAARTMRAPIAVAITPGTIEVMGVREPNVAWAMPDRDKPNCKPES